MIAAALSMISGVAVSKERSTHCNALDAGPIYNKVELSEKDKCWLNHWKADDISGTLGSIYWMRIGDGFVSMKVRDLQISGSEKAAKKIVMNNVVNAIVAEQLEIERSLTADLQAQIDALQPLVDSIPAIQARVDDLTLQLAVAQDRIVMLDDEHDSTIVNSGVVTEGLSVFVVTGEIPAASTGRFVRAESYENAVAAWNIRVASAVATEARLTAERNAANTRADNEANRADGVTTQRDSLLSGLANAVDGAVGYTPGVGVTFGANFTEFNAAKTAFLDGGSAAAFVTVIMDLTAVSSVAETDDVAGLSDDEIVDYTDNNATRYMGETADSAYNNAIPANTIENVDNVEIQGVARFNGITNQYETANILINGFGQSFVSTVSWTDVLNKLLRKHLMKATKLDSVLDTIVVTMRDTEMVSVMVQTQYDKT